MEFVTHLESPIDGTTCPADEIQTTHAGRPLLVRYDLDRIERPDFSERPMDMWRYRELLPVDGEPVSLGETMTPLLECLDVLVKDESHLPTGSFKARGMAMAITRCKRLGIDRVVLPSAGNAGGAAAAYAARAGIACTVFMPADTPLVNRLEARLFGAEVVEIDGHIGDCGKLAAEADGFNLATLREPYRIEGKKTMGLELAEQLGWTLPDAIFYPTGGGTGLIGMHKAFEELRALGWIEGTTRFFACQTAGCALLQEPFATGAEFAEPVPDPRTIAAGLRVPAAIGDFLMLRALRESGGGVFTAEEDRLRHWMREAGKQGIGLCPEAAACFDGVAQARATGQVSPGDRIVVFNTGAAQKYVEVLDTI